MIQQSPVPPSAASDPGQEKTVFVNIWSAVRRRKWTIVLCAAAGLTLGLVLAFLVGPEYESTAQILVLKKQLDSTPLSGPMQAQPQLEDYLSSHQVIITSPRIIDQAIRQGNLETLSCFQGKKNVRKAIIESLSVNRVFKVKGGGPPNNILNLAFHADNPDDPPLVLKAVVASYEQFLKDTYRNVTAETLELIARARNVLHNDLEAKEKAYQKFREQNFILGKDKDGNTVPEARLFSIDTKRSLLRMRQAEIQAFLTAIDNARKKGRSQDEVLGLIAAIPTSQQLIAPGLLTSKEPTHAGRSVLATIEEEYLNLQLQESKLLEEFGPKHPQVLAVQSRLQILRRLSKPSGPLRTNSPNQPKKDDNLVDLKIESLRQEFNENKRTQEALTQLFELEKKEAKGFIISEAQNDVLSKGVERSRLLYESIVKRLQEMDTVKEYGGFNTHGISQPEGGKWVWKQPFLLTSFALLLGLAAGLLGSYFADSTDKSFRTPKDIRLHLGKPVLSHIPLHLPRKGAVAESDLDPLLLSYHRPNSCEADAYRAVRTAMCCCTMLGEHSIVQITSPDKGDGKTTLASNLAVSLAQAGKRVLLVDADMRRPRVHAVFGQQNEEGLSSLLADNAEATDLICQTPVGGLSVLSSGPLPQYPAELLTLPRLNEVLDSVRRQYDYVLVDTPPLLSGTDAAIMGTRADGVILALRITKDCRSRAERAKEILDQVGAKVLGIVVIGVHYKNGSAAHGFEPYPDNAEYR